MIGKGTLETNLLIVHFAELDRVGTYKGETLDGIPSGNGTFTAVNDAGETYTYTREWKNGILNGYGTRHFPADESSDEIGTFVDGEFKPTLPDLFETLGVDPKFHYVVYDKSKQFFNEHIDLFPAQTEAEVTPFVDNELNATRMSKSPKNYGDKLMRISKAKVFQIYEFECYDRVMTFINVEGANRSYYSIYYPGTIDVYDGETVTVYGLPLNAATYENLGASYTQTYVLAGSFIKK